MGTPTPEFKFGDAEGQNPSTVKKVAKLEAYLAAYTDGENKEQARICFRIPGSDSTFIMNMSISGKNVVTQAHPWFHKAFTDKLRSEGFEDGSQSEAAESL